MAIAYASEKEVLRLERELRNPCSAFEAHDLLY